MGEGWQKVRIQREGARLGEGGSEGNVLFFSSSSPRACSRTRELMSKVAVGSFNIQDLVTQKTQHECTQSTRATPPFRPAYMVEVGQPRRRHNAAHITPRPLETHFCPPSTLKHLPACLPALPACFVFIQSLACA